MNWQWFKLARERRSLMILDNAKPPRWLYRWCRWRWKRNDWGKLLIALHGEIDPNLWSAIAAGTLDAP